jgi:hypothetical protein
VTGSVRRPFPALAININQPVSFVHWSIFNVSVANLVLIAVVVVIFGAARRDVDRSSPAPRYERLVSPECQGSGAIAALARPRGSLAGLVPRMHAIVAIGCDAAAARIACGGSACPRYAASRSASAAAAGLASDGITSRTSRQWEAPPAVTLER